MRKKVAKKSGRIKAGRRRIARWGEDGVRQEGRWKMIRMLGPVGLGMAEKEMEAEAGRWVGRRYARGKTHGPWGSNAGSIYLGDQKVSVRVPRVRNRGSNEEVVLWSYQALQNPGTIDELVFRRVLKGLSQRCYEEAALGIPATFGISKSSVWRRFVKASGKRLRVFLERDLSAYDIVSIVLDGKNVFAIHGRGIQSTLAINSPTGLLGDSDLAEQDAAVRLCPTGALMSKRVGFEVPIGARAYDQDPISVLELLEYRKREAVHG